MVCWGHGSSSCCRGGGEPACACVTSPSDARSLRLTIAAEPCRAAAAAQLAVMRDEEALAALVRVAAEVTTDSPLPACLAGHSGALPLHCKVGRMGGGGVGGRSVGYGGGRVAMGGPGTGGGGEVVHSAAGHANR